MLKKLIRFNYNIVTKRPKTVLSVVLILTVIAVLFAASLRLELNWVALAPKGHPAVLEYQEIMDDFPSLSNITVVVESGDYNKLKTVSKEIEKSFNGLSKYVESVNAGFDQDFALRHAFSYMNKKDIMLTGYALSDPNIDAFYNTVHQSLNGSLDLLKSKDVKNVELDMTRSSLRALSSLIKSTDKGLKGEDVSDKLRDDLTRFFTGDGMYLSPDGNMAVITVQPTFSMMDLNKIMPGINKMEKIITDLDEKYPDVKVGFTGMHVVARDETESIESGSAVSTLLSILLILFLLYLAFRTFMAPVMTFVPLLIGIIWDVGLTRILVGRLNMMTVFAAAMLIGLGVDFAIHLYSSYTEKRVNTDKNDALYKAMTGTGPSIIIGALTTACAFFALNISKLRMLRELGTVMGTGIITTLISVFWMLPAIITLKKEKETSIKQIKGKYHILGKTATFLKSKRILVAVILLLLTIFMGYKASFIDFDLSLLSIEPKGLKSISLMKHMVDEYDMSTDSFSVEVDSLDEVYRLQKEFEKVDGVSYVESIATVLPQKTNEEEKSDVIKQVNAMVQNKKQKRTADTDKLLLAVNGISKDLDKIYNIWSDKGYEGFERSDYDAMKADIKRLKSTLEDYNQNNLKALSSSFYDTYEGIGDKMLSNKKLTLNALPESFKSQYISEDGNKYLVSVYPDFEIWENLKSEKGKRFVEDLMDIAPAITGTPLFMKVLYEAAAKEAGITGGVVFIILLVILMVYFKSIKYVLKAFTPLALTLIFTVGTMVLIDLHFNIINFLSLLLIIGIGIDDGVHILHHYKTGEGDVNYVFSSVGRAILLTSLTTMCGFGSLMFSAYTGVATLGIVLTLGVGYAFVMTVIVLPLLLKDRKKQKVDENI